MKKSLWLALVALVAVTAPAAAQEAEHAAASGPLTVEGGLVLWTIFVFLILLFVLRKFAWPQILGAVEARERSLEEQLAQAKRDREEAAALLEEHRRLVQDGRAQAHQLIVEAKAVAERERTVAMEKLREEQDEAMARARREMAAERERALADLRREAVDLSLAAAAKLVGERLDGDADRRLVSEYLATIEGTH